MAYSLPKNSLIDYPASRLREFYPHCYEYIDFLHFLQNPKEFLCEPEKLEEYIGEASALLEAAGWDGDGEIQLLWLPPFVFPYDKKVGWGGVIIWFVKQEEDGLSWMLSPVELPFEYFE